MAIPARRQVITARCLVGRAAVSLGDHTASILKYGKLIPRFLSTAIMTKYVFCKYISSKQEFLVITTLLILFQNLY